MGYKSLFTFLLNTSVHFGASIVIFTLSQTCFKLLGLTPETNLGFTEVLETSLTKNKQKPSKAPNDKPNSLKHVRHSVLKLQ
jgi:hypothetical protein